MPSLTQTTLSAALSANGTVLTVASATGISSPTNNFYQKIYVINPGQMRGQLMSVLAVNGTQITVSRIDGSFSQSFLSGALVLIANVDPTIPGFYDHNPDGAPSAAPYFTTPWVNIVTGEQWLSSISNDWQPGWNNPMLVSNPTAVQTIPAGVMTPGSRLFHSDTGTAAMTGIARPLGFAGGSFTIIPGGAFTWTTGDGSIGLGGTAVVGKALTFTYDSNAAKWYANYIA